MRLTFWPWLLKANPCVPQLPSFSFCGSFLFYTITVRCSSLLETFHLKTEVRPTPETQVRQQIMPHIIPANLHYYILPCMSFMCSLAIRTLLNSITIFCCVVQSPLMPCLFQAPATWCVYFTPFSTVRQVAVCSRRYIFSGISVSRYFFLVVLFISHQIVGIQQSIT